MLVQEEEGVPAELRHLPEYKELLELKRLKKRRLREIREESSAVQHTGFKVPPIPNIIPLHHPYYITNTTIHIVTIATQCMCV